MNINKRTQLLFIQLMIIISGIRNAIARFENSNTFAV
jgi:hypothetical protein